jgi:hypothetical protein
VDHDRSIGLFFAREMFDRLQHGQFAGDDEVPPKLYISYLQVDSLGRSTGSCRSSTGHRESTLASTEADCMTINKRFDALVHEVTVSSLKVDKARAVLRKATADFEAAMRENQTPTERDKLANHNTMEGEAAVAKLKEIGKAMYTKFVKKGGALALEATAAKVFQDQVRSAAMEFLADNFYLIGRGPTDAIERTGNALAQA